MPFAMACSQSVSGKAFASLMRGVWGSTAPSTFENGQLVHAIITDLRLQFPRQHDAQV